MKYLKITLALVCFLLTGCIKHVPEPNEKRGDHYEFDIVDYLDISAFGEDGNGYLEIRTKEITVEDFYDDAEYINVKKDLDNINAYLIPLYNSTVNVSQAEGLKNGDVVTIQFPYDPANLYSDMNIENYDFVVSGLKEAEEINLFDEKAVKFFADEKGGLHYLKKSGYLPKEITEMLSYNITTEDAVEASKTVMNITATLDENYLMENGYYSTAVYFAKHGYKASLEAEVVLRDVVKPTDFSGIGTTKIESALFDMLEMVEDEEVVKVCSIQKTYRQQLDEPYSFTVIYYDLINNEKVYFSRAFDVYYVDDELVFENIGTKNMIEEGYATKPLPEAEVIMKFTN